MDSKRKIVKDLDRLSEAELEQLARYVESLKRQAGVDEAPPNDEQRLAAFYADPQEDEPEPAEEGPDNSPDTPDGEEE